MLFKYTRPKNSKSMGHCATALKALDYCMKKALDTDTINMNSLYNAKPNEINKEFKELQKLNGKCSGINQRKYYEFIASPKEKPSKEPEKRKEFEENLMNYGRELAQEKFKDCQVVIALHNDSSNGYNLHFIINAVKTDLKKVNIMRADYEKIKDFASDELSKKYGFTPMTKADRRKKSEIKHTQYDYTMEKQGTPTEKTKIQDNIFNILTKEKPTSESEFIKLAQEQGIKIETFKSEKTGEMQYRYSTKNYEKGFSGKTLGNIFEKSYIDLRLKAQLEINNKPNEKIDIEDLINKYSTQYKEDKIKESKAVEDKLYKLYSDTYDKIDEIDDKKLKIYNQRYGKNYSKEDFKDELNKIWNNRKGKTPDIIENGINGIFNIVIKLIKELLSITLSNQYDRGYR